MNTSYIINAIRKKIDSLNALPVMNSTDETVSNLTQAFNDSVLEMSSVKNSHSNVGWLYLFIVAVMLSLFAAALHIIRSNDEPNRRKELEKRAAIELKEVTLDNKKTQKE